MARVFTQNAFKWMIDFDLDWNEVIDYDGWDRSNLEFSLSRAISEDTFWHRLANCSVMMSPKMNKFFLKHERNK